MADEASGQRDPAPEAAVQDTAERLIERIAEAFASAQYPGSDALTDSTYGEEPVALVTEFTDRTDWTALSSAFLDQAPDGWSSALSFFSARALQFYLPAYLIADVRGELDHCDPAVRLCAFVTPQASAQKIAQVFGGGTMGEHERTAFAVFDEAQVGAIVAYLWWRLDHSAYDPTIEQALESYWLDREQDATMRREFTDPSIHRRPHEDAVRTLLGGAGLPASDLRTEMLDHFFACGDRNEPMGIVGVELFGTVALLRSLVVHPEARGSGCGRALVAAVERHARAAQVERLYLLTETAKTFFESLGYQVCARDDAPGEICATTEFSELCADSAALMVKHLGEADAPDRS